MNLQIWHRIPLVVHHQTTRVIAIVATSIAAITLMVAWHVVNTGESVYYDPLWRPVILVLLNFPPWATVLTLGVVGGSAGYVLHAALLRAARLRVIQENVAGEHNEVVGALPRPGRSYLCRLARILWLPLLGSHSKIRVT